MPASSSNSTSFALLDERIQRWIWNEQWTALRDIQERAISVLLRADQDVIIAAATATGKTEAAFFPILSHLAQQAVMGLVIYISPLKALINDQWLRLAGLCETLDIPVIGWHGDISAHQKKAFLKTPQGILLITPESLEALLVRRGSAIKGITSNLRYVVIDELHAFIGAERGKQLQSQLHRIEQTIGRRVPRVGLSATLGDMRLAAQFLRADQAQAIHIITSKNTTQETKILIKGYVESIKIDPDLSQTEAMPTSDHHSQHAIAAHLYQTLKGSNNLIFPNSKHRVEQYADLLRRHCQHAGRPNEFWPHHGSLSKDLREETEGAFQNKTTATTAVCTNTLELGIDIGTIKSVCQIGPPPSVASLRQRLGRSGRRKGESAILRGYCVETPLTPKSNPSDTLREGLVQFIAMVQLLSNAWFEPPQTQGLHYSTLVQQILSVIAEKGGATASLLWSSLVKQGPFQGIAQEDFIALLKHMGELTLLSQESSGLLLLGELGEKMVNRYDFYAAFSTHEEFRLIADGKTLGSLPISRPLTAEQHLIFGGRRWRVLDVDSSKKLIIVAPSKGGTAPVFDGSSSMIHDRVRLEMRAILASDQICHFIDTTATQLLTEARQFYKTLGLDTLQMRDHGNDTLLFTWRGDRVNDGLVVLLSLHNIIANNEGLTIVVSKTNQTQLQAALKTIAETTSINAKDILLKTKNLVREKWDWALPEHLLRSSYASLNLDLHAAQALARQLAHTD